MTRHEGDYNIDHITTKDLANDSHGYFKIDLETIVTKIQFYQTRLESL